MDDKVLKIRNLLNEKNISYDDLAKKIGKTTQTIANYLNGRTKFDLETFEKICKILGVPVSYFFEEGVADAKKIMVGNNQVNIGSQNVQTINNNAENLHALELCRKELDGLKNQLEEKERLIQFLINK